MVLTEISKNGYQQTITFLLLIKKRILLDTFVKNHCNKKQNHKWVKLDQRRVSQIPRDEKDTLFFPTLGE